MECKPIQDLSLPGPLVIIHGQKESEKIVGRGKADSMDKEDCPIYKITKLELSTTGKYLEDSDLSQLFSTLV